ncbi:MAG: carboxypeptidase regulatory-like domain-containing protein, partial [Acidobacteriota bacterium]|nr:carboxypeptidase regulatory-like domain-containing protein [Acidobacteriota bacterium]
LGFTSISFAQGRQAGTISGTIMDNEGNPLPGATITLSGPALMGTKSYVAGSEGKFRFVALLPGEYEVKVELSGFNTYIRKGLRCSVGKTTECRVRLTIKTVEEEITVMAESPTVDIESSKMSVHYDTNFLLSIPHGRDLYGITQSLPGAIAAEGGREYTRMTSILGGSIRSTLYQLDGAIMNDPVTTYAAANINVDVYEEIEIGIGSLPAEVGMTDTAVVNIVSKSGGNKFSGAVSSYYTGSGLAEDLWSEEQMEAIDVVEPRKYANYLDGSVSFGGPIIKDRLWFFLNGRRIDYTQDLPYTAHNRIAKIYDVNPDAFSPKDLEPYDLEHDDWLGFAKLTFQISKNLRYMGMFHFNDVYEPIYSLRTGNSRAWSYTAIVDHERVYTTSHHFNWVLDQNTFLEIRGNYVNRHYPNLARPENANNYTSYDRKQAVYWGNTSLTDDYYRKRYGASASLTKFQDDLLGASHEFKLGVDWEDTIYARDRCRGYEQGDNPYYTYWRDFAAGNKYYRSSSGKRGRLRMRPYSYLGGGMIGEDNTRRFSAFAQDSITTGRLAINAGLRFSYSYAYEPEQTRPELLNYKVGPEFLNPNLLYDHNILLKALNDQYHNDPGIDYNQLSALDPYTFPYRKTIEFKTLSPRIGLIYDLFGDGKTAIKLSFARYYEPIFSGKYNAPQLFGGSLSWDWYDLNKNGYMDLPSTGPVDHQFIDPSGDKYVLTSYNNQDPNFKYYQDVKSPYMHEFIAGVEHELMKDFRVGAQFIYKENKNITEDVDRNNDYHPDATDDQGRPIWLPYTVTDPGWDAEFGTDDDQQLTVYGLADYAPTQSWLGTTPEGLKRNYMAGVLTFDKRMSNRWQLKGSIIYSAYKGNASPSYGATEGENTLLDNPNTLINYYGRTLYDHPLQIKLMGTVILPYDLIFTAYFHHQSGSPWARTLNRVYFPSDIPTDWSYASGILTEPSGSRRNPAYTMLDMRLEKSFSFGDYGKLSFYVDIFNVGARKTLNVERNPNGRLWFYRDPPKYSLQSNYGRINSVSGVRSIRVGLRYSF